MLKISRPNISEQDIREVVRVIESGDLVQGQVCAQFEADLSRYLGDVERGDPHVALVSSGTAALHLALLALSVQRDDYVLVPNFTFPATINAIHLVGALPIVVDVCPRRYVITPDIFTQAVNSIIEVHGRPPRALLLVHEFGCPVDMVSILKIADRHGGYVIEDAACALGAADHGYKVGAIGHIGCFSFHPRKTLTTGEGGLVSTMNADLIERVRKLRNHGMALEGGGIEFKEPGFNYRMTNFQAALGLRQLASLDSWIERRRYLANKYCELISSSPCAELISLPEIIDGHSWQTFMVVVPTRRSSDLIVSLKTMGIECNIGAQVLTSIQYVRNNEDHYVLKSADPVQSRMMQGHTLALPLCEQYSDDDLKRVVEALEFVLASGT